MYIGIDLALPASKPSYWPKTDKSLLAKVRHCLSRAPILYGLNKTLPIGGRQPIRLCNHSPPYMIYNR